MAIQVQTDPRPEMMQTDVYIYEVLTTEPVTRRVLQPDGQWVDAGSAGFAATPTFSLPDDVVPRLVVALGVPMSDVHLADALRVERGRVDRMVDAMTEAVTRGL